MLVRGLMRGLCLCSVVFVVACSKPTILAIDAGPERDAGVEPDAGAADAGPIDAGVADAGLADAGPVDAGPPYQVALFNLARISSDSSAPNFHRQRTPMVIGSPPFTRVILVADLSTTCFPFESWQQNPPPQGQNWPANCDAFDRNFELTLDEPTDAGQPPAFELIRAITPFGGPLHVEADLTDLANVLPAGTHQVQVEIPTYSDGAGLVSGSNGGWNVSAHLEVVPGPAPRKVLAAIPIFNRSQGAGASSPATIAIPAGVASVRLEYRATGHGGAAANTGLCIGPADEFCQRNHHLEVDGAEIFALVPWRTNCVNNCTVKHYGAAASGFDYCLENPCGNMNSVRAPRANWCPGTVTPAFNFDPPPLYSAGVHTFDVTVDDIAQGGSWRQSATLYLFGP